MPDISSRAVTDPSQQFGAVPLIALHHTGPAGNGQGHGQGHGSGAGAGARAGPGGGRSKLQFLEFVTCALCGHDFYAPGQAQRKFWMLSCGHVLCGGPEHSHQSGRCTFCKKEGVETYAIDDKLQPELHQWFIDPREHLGDISAHVNQGLQAVIQAVQQFQEGKIAVVQFQNEQLMTLVARLRRDVAAHVAHAEASHREFSGLADKLSTVQAMQEELNRVKEENEALKNRNDELEAVASTATAPTHRSSSARPSSRAQHRSHTHLASVAETDEEEEEGSGVRYLEQSIAADQHNEPRDRDRDRFTTPRPAIHAPRVTLPPHSIAAGRGDYHRSSGDGMGTDRDRERERNMERMTRSAPRLDIGRFTYADTGAPNTAYSAHPYTRPTSSMGRPSSRAGRGLSMDGGERPARPFSSMGMGVGTSMSVERGARPFVPGPFRPETSQNAEYQPRRFPASYGHDMDENGQMMPESINGIGTYIGARDGQDEGGVRGFEVAGASGSKRTRAM